MDIVRSLELESFILTKLTKPFVPVNLVGPLYWVPASRGVFIFLCVIRRHFLVCEDIAGGSELTAGGTFFSRNTEALPMGPSCHVEESFFERNKEAFPYVDPYCQPLPMVVIC